MALTPEKLDGKYLVQSETSDGGPFRVNGDGETEIKNGLTFRTDSNGYVWESAFSILNQKQVQIESTLDPTNSAASKLVKSDQGTPTREIVTYKTVLDVSEENGRLVLTGTIDHAGEVTNLKMTRL